MTKSGTFLSSAEIVRRFGVSGKALRLYEAHGLLKAERTRAGWRIYGPNQIARLHQVLALKSFGFPLGRIAELLAGGLPDLPTFLALHEQVLRQQAARTDRAIRLLSAARIKLANDACLSSDDLMQLVKDADMTGTIDDVAAAYRRAADRHLSSADKARLSANGFRSMTEPDPLWPVLHAEAARLMAAGDPCSTEAIDLARRWMGKVFEGTGGDPALTQAMRAVARDAHDDPAFAAASSSSNAMMDFVSQAYGAAIAAGIMPKPTDAP